MSLIKTRFEYEKATFQNCPPFPKLIWSQMRRRDRFITECKCAFKTYNEDTKIADEHIFLCFATLNFAYFHGARP